MQRKIVNKAWVSSLTAFTFAIVSITGILMLFHVPLFSVHVLHELMGLLFVIVGVIHLVYNWGAFVSYMRLRSAKIALAVIVALSLIMLAAGAVENERHGRPDGPPERSSITNQSIIVC